MTEVCDCIHNICDDYASPERAKMIRHFLSWQCSAFRLSKECDVDKENGGLVVSFCDKACKFFNETHGAGPWTRYVKDD